MMESFIIGFPIIIAVALAFVVAAESVLRWIARSEPDVNGDPEKDGSGIANLKPNKFYGEEWDEIERTEL